MPTMNVTDDGFQTDVLESDKLERAMDILKKAIEVYNAR